MVLSLKEQIIKLITEKGKILLTTHAKPDGDAIGSVLAFALILKKIGKKNVAIHCADALPEVFGFLPNSENFVQKTSFTNDLVISLDCEGISIDKLRWTRKNNRLNILVSPKEGEFSTKDINIAKSSSIFSLIITLDVADRHQMGSLFTKNTEMFSATEIINIDHHVSNTGFGTVNLIDSKAASTTEVIYSLIAPLEKNFGIKIMDKDIATLLLAGIITDTGSFQNPNTTPKTFEIAAELIEQGAKQQEIIRRLFKTKSLSALKLWGRVLSKIQNDPVHRFVWSAISEQDLQDSSASSDDLQGVLDDLLSSAPGAEVVLLLKEREDGIVSGSLRTTSNAIDAAEIAELFGGGGHKRAAGFKIAKQEGKFNDIAKEVIARIQEYQARRLGIIAPPKVETKKEQIIKNGIKTERVLDFSMMSEPEKAVNLDFTKSKAIVKPKNNDEYLKMADSIARAQKVFEEAKKALEEATLEKAQNKSKPKTKVKKKFRKKNKQKRVAPKAKTQKKEKK